MYPKFQIDVEPSDQLQVAFDVSPGRVIPIEVGRLESTEEVQLIHVLYGSMFMCVVVQLEDAVNGRR